MTDDYRNTLEIAKIFDKPSNIDYVLKEKTIFCNLAKELNANKMSIMNQIIKENETYGPNDLIPTILGIKQIPDNIETLSTTVHIGDHSFDKGEHVFVEVVELTVTLCNQFSDTNIINDMPNTDDLKNAMNLTKMNFNACDKSNKVEMFSELLAEPNQKQFLDQELGKKIETQTIFVKINPKGLPLKLCKFEIHWVKMNFLSVFGNFLVDTEIRKSVHKEILRKPVEHKLFEFVINNLTKVLKINQEIGLIEQTFANNKDPNHSEWFKNQLNERMKKKPFYIKKATFETKVIKQIHEEKYDKLNKIANMKRDIINTLEKIFDKVDLISNDANSLDVISNDTLTNLINENVLQMLIKINRKLLIIIDVFVYDGLFEPTPHINKKTIIELMAKSTSQLEDQ